MEGSDYSRSTSLLGGTFEHSLSQSSRYVSFSPEAFHSAELSQRSQSQPCQPQRRGCCSCIFPLSCCPCCPCIPRHVTTIRTCTHLTVIAGTVACLCLSVRIGSRVVSSQCFTEDELFCALDMAYALLVVPCLPLFVKTALYYTSSERERFMQLDQRRQELQDAYSGLLAEVETKLEESVGSSAALAERHFASLKRDFTHFLSSVPTSACFSSSDEDASAVAEFRRFLLHWLQVYSECTFDPLERPLCVVLPAELDSCVTIAELAQKTCDRLQLSHVNIIHQKCQTQQEFIRGLRQKLQADPHGNVHKCCGSPMTWLTCQRMRCACWSEAGQPDVDPENVCACRMCCLRILLFSPSHALLAVEAFYALSIFPLAIYLKDVGGLLLILVTEWCTILLLARYENLNSVDVLKQSLRRLESEDAAVKEFHANAIEFFNKANRRSQLWLNRTFPRLELLKEIYHLVAVTTDPIASYMASINERLARLEEFALPLAVWCNDETPELGRHNIKLGKEIMKICNAKNLRSLLKGVDILMDNVTDNSDSDTDQDVQVTPSQVRRPSVRRVLDCMTVMVGSQKAKIMSWNHSVASSSERPWAPASGPPTVTFLPMDVRDDVSFFVIKVVPKDGDEPPWTLRRRYSQFHTLSCYLGCKSWMLPDAPFPRKTLHKLMQRMASDADVRMSQLRTWLQKALEHEEWWPQLATFLRDNSPAHSENETGDESDSDGKSATTPHPRRSVTFVTSTSTASSRTSSASMDSGIAEKLRMGHRHSNRRFSQTGAWPPSVTFVRVTVEDRTGFEILVAFPGNRDRWTVTRTHRQFRELAKDLGKTSFAMALVQGVPFPAKGVTSWGVKMNRRRLEKWLRWAIMKAQGGTPWADRIGKFLSDEKPRHSPVSVADEKPRHSRVSVGTGPPSDTE